MYKFVLGGVPLCRTPGEVTCETSNRNEEFVTIDGLTINKPKICGLSTYTFSFLAPLEKYSNNNNPPNLKLISFYNAEDICRLIDVWKTNIKYSVFYFNIIREMGSKSYFPTSTKATLEDCKWTESTEHMGFMKFEFTLKQYLDRITQKLSVSKQEDGTNKIIVEYKRERADNREIPDTVTVQRGDTLFGIAKKYLNNGEKWRELREINNISNPNRLQIGQIIKLR